MAFSGEVTHLATVIAPLVAVLSPLVVILEFNFDLLPSEVALVISLDTLNRD